MKSLQLKMFMITALVALAACDKSNRSISILGEDQTFQQISNFQPRKIDILWIVDNSGSMGSSQTNLVSNFGSFINRFQSLNYDFHMAVQTSDAFLGKFKNEDYRRRLKDGANGNFSGVYVMDRNTPNLSSVFLTNATQGINGSGDERAFSSFLDTLDYVGNADFRRPDAFLAIIIVSDEDDFSATTTTFLNNDYNSPNLIPVSTYKNFLDGFAGASNYSVNAITILDNACLAKLNSSFSGRRIGQRYIDLANQSNGVKASLCGDFAQSLQLISDTIITTAQSFVIDREPVPGTLKIYVNGVEVLENPTTGYTYDAATRTVTFSTAASPPAGASIQVVYDPLTLRD
ncbi:MAG: hypothetical protein ACK5UJ_03765 [Pseudobdellovibrionaceae bacterium]